MIYSVWGSNIFIFSQSIKSILSFKHLIKLLSTESPEYYANFAKELKSRLSDLEVERIKSSGPGGQNVNKRNTKVRLKFDIAECTWLSELAKQKLERQEANRINKEGFLVLECQEHRTQEQNHNKILKILKKMLQLANETEHNLSKQTILRMKERKRYLQKKSRSARKHQLIAARKKEENEISEATNPEITKE